MIRRFKINGLPSPKELDAMSFGRSIDTLRAIEKWKAGAQSTYLSQKRQSYQSAIKDAILLLQAKEYFCRFYCDSERKDDTFEFFFTI